MMEKESYASLEESLTYAMREEAMARSKGWAAADDWATIINRIRTQMVSHHMQKNSVVTAYAVIDDRGDVQLLTTLDTEAYDYASKLRYQVCPLYGLHHGK